MDSAKLKKADGLYIFCHGSPAFLQLGIENVTHKNIKIFKDIIDRIGVIEIYACSPAGQTENRNYEEKSATTTFVNFLYDWQLFQVMAFNVNASVKVAREIQSYSWNPRTLEIDFGKWEGSIITIFPPPYSPLEGGSGVVKEGGSNY